MTVIPYLSIFALTIHISILIYTRLTLPRHPLRKAFHYNIALLSIWCLMDFLIPMAVKPAAIPTFLHLRSSVHILLPSSLFLFAMLLKRRRVERTFYILLPLTLIPALGVFLSGLFITGFVSVPGGLQVIPGPLYYPLIIWSMLISFTAIIQEQLKKDLSGLSCKGILLGVIIFSIVALTMEVLLPQIGFFSSPPGLTSSYSVILTLFMFQCIKSQSMLFHVEQLTASDLFHHIKDALVITDLQEKILRINKKGLDLLPLKNFQYAGLALRDIFPSYDPSLTGQDQEISITQNGKNHLYVCNSHTLSNTINEIGKLIILRDISQKKKSELELELRDKKIKQHSLYSKLKEKIWLYAQDLSLNETGLMQKIFDKTGPVLGVSRICFNRLQGTNYICEIEWRAENVSTSVGTKIPTQIVNAFLKEDYLEFDLETIEKRSPSLLRPVITGFLNVLFKEQNIKSTLAVPCRVEDIMYGLVSFDICRDNAFKSGWSEEKKSLIPDMVRIISQTISRRRIHSSLVSRENLYRSLFEHMTSGFSYQRIIQNNTGNAVDFLYVSINKTWEKIYGIPAQKVTGQPHSKIFSQSDQKNKDWIKTMAKVGLEGKPWNGEFYYKPTRKWISLTAYCPEPGYFASISEDVTEKRAHQEQLEYIASHDDLSGLPNRKALETELEQLIQNAQPDDQKAVLFIGLDNFKYINDTFGHSTGDGLLVDIAGRLLHWAELKECVYRFGGDQFCIILDSLSGKEEAENLSHELVARLVEPYVHKSQEITLSPRIGISLFPQDGIRTDELMRNADTAMYNAKTRGRRTLFFTQEMNEQASERVYIENQLSHALERKELFLHYQPIVNHERKVIGTEALIRWQHPEMGLVRPDKFIPVAESTGQIIPIGAWVLEEACKTLVSSGPKKNFQLSVNLSLRQFMEDHLVERVADIIKKTGIPPASLCLELTESATMDDPEKVIFKMKALRELGLSLAIDDFGTGYSSLSYLARLPVSSMKIDRSFIASMLGNSNTLLLVKSIISLAHNLDLTVVAEGIEESGQHDYLIGEGCDRMQGFLYGRPDIWDKLAATA